MLSREKSKVRAFFLIHVKGNIPILCVSRFQETVCSLHCDKARLMQHCGYLMQSVATSKRLITVKSTELRDDKSHFWCSDLFSFSCTRGNTLRETGCGRGRDYLYSSQTNLTSGSVTTSETPSLKTKTNIDPVFFVSSQLCNILPMPLVTLRRASLPGDTLCFYSD